MSAIPFVDLRLRSTEIGELIHDSILRVLESGQFIGGAEVEDFENDWAQYCGTRYAVGVSNGLEAIRLALAVNDIGPGDEVLVPAQTFVATWLAVTQVGATPVPVDIESDSANMNPILARDLITDKTAAIILVHLHGLMGSVEEFRNLADRHGLLLIEDAAQAHGAQRAGKVVGNWGDLAAFSFYPTKNLGAVGDAGAITTNDEELARKLKSLRSYGVKPGDKYRYLYAGWNSRMDPIQAAVLRTSLPYLDEWNSRRRSLAKRWSQLLEGRLSISRLASQEYGPEHVWHHFVVKTDKRDWLRQHLKLEGVETEIHYPVAPIGMEMFKEFVGPSASEFPQAIEHQNTVLSLPLHPWLGDQAKVVERVISNIE